MKWLKSLILLFAFFFFNPLQALAECGKAEVAKGKVEVQKSDGSKSPLAVGGAVCTGDSVITGADSRAKIIMPGDNALNINPESQIKVETYEHKPDTGKKKVVLNVVYGKMRATVNTKYTGVASNGEAQVFQVKTKSAVAGVRGTDFLTSYSPKTNNMQVVTFEGKVEVGQAGPGGKIVNSVQVGPGTKTDVAEGKPPTSPKPVPKTELQEMNKQSEASTASSGSSNSSNSTGSNGQEDKDKEKEKEKEKDKNDKSDSKDSKNDKKEGNGDKEKSDGKSEGKNDSAGESKGGDDKAKPDDKKSEKNESSDGKDGKSSQQQQNEKNERSPSSSSSSNNEGGGSNGRSSNGSDSTASGGPSSSGPNSDGPSSGKSATSGSTSMGGGAPPPPTMSMMPPPSNDLGGGMNLPAIDPGLHPGVATPVVPTVPVYVPPAVVEPPKTTTPTGPSTVNVKICIAGDATCN